MDDQNAQVRRTRELVRKAMQKLPELFSKEGNRRFVRTHLEVQDVEFLVSAAREGDKDAIDILRVHARGARRAGTHVPDDLHEFVWEYFIDGQPKAKSGSSPKDTALRNQSIAVLVKIASEWLPVYRNVEYRGGKDGPACALQIVAEELGLEERTVEEIWQDRKASVTRRPG